MSRPAPADQLGMTFLASRTHGAESYVAAEAPTPTAAPARRPLHAITEPTRDWVEVDGRWVCHVSAEDRREAVLSPLPAEQTMRLLELDGTFHILTGPVADDRAMKIAAEDLIAGF